VNASRRAVVVAISSLAIAGCAAPPSAKSPLVGAWRSSIQFESSAFATVKDLEFMYVFHDDRTLTESSNYDAAPPVPPAYGIWRPVGPNEFEARYEFYSMTPTATEAFQTGAGWMPSGRGILTERIKLAEDGASYTSTITYEALDREGKPVAGGGSAQGRGARMRFEPSR